MNGARVLWRPDPNSVADTNIERFRNVAEARTHRSLEDHHSLYHWSIDQPEEFWSVLWDFLDPLASRRWDSAIVPAAQMRDTKFFKGARLNFAQNLLRHRNEEVAIIFRDESEQRLVWTFADLKEQVALTAAGLREAGVGVGDRVAGFVPNHPQAAVAMLAATSIGAIWSSCSPDFGTKGVLDRFGQIAPKVLFTADGYTYNGKQFNCVARVSEWLDSVPSIERVVVFPYLSESPELGRDPRFVMLSDFQVPGATLEFAQLPFDHPAFILYTSGTTGVPKCIVHGAGGPMIKLMLEHQLHCDLGHSDRLFFHTTAGWMMWNWMVNGLASGCTLVCYDGSPLPSGEPDILWRIAEEEGVTAMGAGARYFGMLQKQGVEPIRDFDLSKLRLLMSTGSVLPPESYDFVYDKVKPDVLLASITGGTDLLSTFALGAPTCPLHRGEIQCRCLGMAVEIFNDDGKSVTGERGELVCCKPFPSMPVKFWNDPDGSRYHKAYFDKFHGVWCHGDFAEITPHGSMIMYGRSDAVLNPGGVRIGTAEIYSRVEQVPEVLESVCVGQDWEDDVRVVLFVVLKAGYELTEELDARIRHTIRSNATPRHVPSKILAVPDIPRTRSGKIAEISVRDCICGREVKNTNALENPESLEYFKDREELAA